MSSNKYLFKPTMAIYAYADETIFTIDTVTNQTALGCGILVSETEITRDVIEEALGNLKSDPDFQLGKDERTISRSYFHASDDSRNAHSHLCASITKHVKCIFDFSYFDNVRERQLSQLKFKENLLSRCLSASTLEFFNSPLEVFLTIEKREGFNDSHAAKWLNQIYHMYEGASYDIPSFKTYFPKIHIALKGKDEPGLQVTDFLMWSINRSKRKAPDNRWLSRLKFKTWHYYRDENGHNRGQYRLNTFPTYSASENYPQPFEEPEEWLLYIKAYILIERFLISLDRTDFPPHAFHLFQDFELISSRMKQDAYHLKSGDLEQIGSVFLRLFDTVPVYKDVDKDDKETWASLYDAKYLASMLVRNGQLHIGRTKDEIQRWRYRMKTEKVEEFKRLIYEGIES